MKMFVAALVAVVLSVGSLTAADPVKKQGCQCDQTGSCYCLFGCCCGSASQQVKFDAPKDDPKPKDGEMSKAVAADETGTPFFKDGKQCGWLDHKTMKFFPYMADKDCFGAACPIPAGATAVKPAAQANTSYGQQQYYGSFGQSGGGCASGSCGSSQGAGRFRR